MVQLIKLQIDLLDAGRGALGATYDGQQRWFEMKAHRDGLSIYVCMLPPPGPNTWLCFPWRKANTTELTLGPVEVYAVELTQELRTYHGVTDAGANLVTVVSRFVR